MELQRLEQNVGADVLRPYAHAVIIEPVHCRQCGYNLRTMRVDGYCPECGLEIRQTILHAIDPTASQLPSIRNPRAVGNALLGLVLVVVVQMLVVVTPGLVRKLAAWEVPGMEELAGALPGATWWVTGALGLCAAACAWMLAPPAGREPPGPVWRDVLLLGAGETTWVVCMGVLSHGWDGNGVREVEVRLGLLGAMMVSGMAGLLGMRGVLQVIGLRSSEYRRSKAGRQGAGAMMGAVGFAAGGAAVRELARARVLDKWWEGTGSLIYWAALLMACIGLGYLLVNAWWIRRALRKPAMTLDQMLLPPLDPDTSIPDTSTTNG